MCANHARSPGAVHGTLVRGLVAAFDDCVAKVQHRNLDHLACTEVRWVGHYAVITRNWN